MPVAVLASLSVSLFPLSMIVWNILIPTIGRRIPTRQATQAQPSYRSPRIEDPGRQ